MASSFDYLPPPGTPGEGSPVAPAGRNCRFGFGMPLGDGDFEGRPGIVGAAVEGGPFAESAGWFVGEDGFAAEAVGDRWAAVRPLLMIWRSCLRQWSMTLSV